VRSTSCIAVASLISNIRRSGGTPAAVTIASIRSTIRGRLNCIAERFIAIGIGASPSRSHSTRCAQISRSTQSPMAIISPRARQSE
jgi:hypothetical protein